MTRSLLTALLAVAASTTFAPAATVTVLDPTQGTNAAPFGVGGGIGTIGRYQQAYASSSFGDAPLTIRQISFFRTSTGWVHDAEYTLKLSTITADIDSLSASDFDGNVGADNQLFLKTRLSGLAPDVLTFEGAPYVYNPLEGNLLLEVITEDIQYLDGFPAHFAESETADGIVSRYYNYGGDFIGRGLATRFSSVPEPTGLATLASLALLVSVRRSGSGRLAGHPGRRFRQR